MKPARPELFERCEPGILNGGQVNGAMKEGRPELFERREPSILNGGQVAGVTHPNS
jgi:hypothetical protein